MSARTKRYILYVSDTKHAAALLRGAAIRAHTWVQDVRDVAPLPEWLLALPLPVLVDTKDQKAYFGGDEAPILERREAKAAVFGGVEPLED